MIFFLFFHAVPGPRQHFFLYTKLPLSLVHSVGKLFLLNRSFKQRKQINRNKLPPGMCRVNVMALLGAYGSSEFRAYVKRIPRISRDSYLFFLLGGRYASVGILHVTARLQGTHTQ